MSRLQPWIYFEDRFRSGMGEVRVAVRLTNAVDEGLVRRGLLAPEQIRTYETDALVDTGATRTVVPQHVVQRLGLTVSSELTVQYADGPPVVVGVTEPLRVDVHGRGTYDEALVLGDEVLIGQTVLEKLDWVVDCQGQRLVQNPRHPDGPVNRV